MYHWTNVIIIIIKDGIIWNYGSIILYDRTHKHIQTYWDNVFTIIPVTIWIDYLNSTGNLAGKNPDILALKYTNG